MATQTRRTGETDSGYAMVALLVGLSIMSVALTVALPAWSTMAKREREAELVFRGEQYARAIQLFQRRYANAFPPNLDLLVDQKFLRRKYKDPITGNDFNPVAVGDPILQQALVPDEARNARGPGLAPPRAGAPQQGRGAVPVSGRLGGIAGAGLIGVVSKSDAKSLRLYNGRDQYNQWVFVAQPATTAAGARGGGQPPGAGDGGLRGRPGGPGGPGGPGSRGPNGPQPGGGVRRGGPQAPFGGGPPGPFPGRGGGQPNGR